MLLSTSTLGYQKGGRFKEAIQIIHDAGFDAFDMSFRIMEQFEDCVFNSDGYLDFAKELKNCADSLGLVCNQAHAPFPSSYIDKERTDAVYKKIVRSMEIAALLGAKYIVVHPKHHISFTENREQLFIENVEFYKSLIPYSEKYGIKIAVENTWQRDPDDEASLLITKGVTSMKEDFCGLLDELPQEYFVACLDIGHVSLVNESITGMITALGHERLKLIHVHDNRMSFDDHTAPFLGKIPFDEVITALKSINYDGDFTLEAIHFELAFPRELKPAAAKLLCETGRYLISKF